MSQKALIEVPEMGLSAQKGEIESNFLTTLTDKPTLNHWVNTILNQKVIQFDPLSRCI